MQSIPENNKEVIKEGDKYLCYACRHDRLRRTGNRLILVGTSVVEVACGNCGKHQVYKVGNYLG